MLSSAELGVSQVMQLPVSHGRLLLIKLIAEMEMFHDILPKYAVAHIHPITPADPPPESTSVPGVHARHPPADSYSHIFPGLPSRQAAFYCLVVMTPDPRLQIALFVLGAFGLLLRSWIPQIFCKGKYSEECFVQN